jgi:hypothetical protein
LNAWLELYETFEKMVEKTREEWAQLHQQSPQMYERHVEVYNYMDGIGTTQNPQGLENKPKPYGMLLQDPLYRSISGPYGYQRYRDMAPPTTQAPPAVQGPQDYGQHSLEKGAAEFPGLEETPTSDHPRPPLRSNPTPTLPTSSGILGVVGSLFPNLPIQSWVDSLPPELRGQLNSGINSFLTNTFGGGGGGGVQKPSAIKPSGAYGLKNEIPKVYKPKVQSIDRYAGDML